MDDEKVVIKQTILKGSSDPDLLQRVALVYIRGKEYRVSAPPEAKGDALEWVKHWQVRELIDINSEIDAEPVLRVFATKLVLGELERLKGDAARNSGLHPDKEHCAAQICMSGHVQHCDGMHFVAKEYCRQCGALCIDQCQHCTEPIRGTVVYQSADKYQRPSFCHACGRAYPWLAERLRTARELLEYDDKLAEDDRQSLWPDLQYVMSNPKADLVPAKRKLIDFKLAKASDWVREAILDLTAKTIAEISKG